MESEPGEATLAKEAQKEVDVRDLCYALVATKRGSAVYYKLSVKLRDTLNEEA